MSFQSLFIRLVFSFLGNMSDRRENSSSEDESDVPERSDQYDTESESASDSSEADSATRIALKSVQKYPNEKDIKEKTSQVFSSFFHSLCVAIISSCCRHV